jgi:hypothetical protein
MVGHMTVFFLVSHKGGVGKTTLALALAEYLSRAPRKRSVCILEFDFFGPCLDYLLEFKHRTKNYFNDFISSFSGPRWTPASLASCLWRPQMGKEAGRGSVTVMPARPGLSDTAPIIRFLDIDHSVNFAREMFGVMLDDLSKQGVQTVICDFHPGMHGWVGSLLGTAMLREKTRLHPVLCTGQDAPSLVGGLVAGQSLRIAVDCEIPSGANGNGNFHLVARCFDMEPPAYLRDRDHLIRELEVLSKKDPARFSGVRLKLALEQASQLADCAAIGNDPDVASRIDQTSPSLLAALEANEQVQGICKSYSGE